MHAPVDNNNYISYITKQIEKSFFIMKNTIIVYATDWCGDCKRSRYYLDQAHIPYQYINIEENEEAMAEVIKINNGFQSVPTIVFPNGKILVEPTNESLKNAIEENKAFL